MDYQLEIDRIIDALQADPNIPKKWRNKAIARLEEAQVFSMVVEDDDTTTVEHPGQPGTTSIQFDGQELNSPAITLDEIPPELRGVANPNQLIGTPPQRPTNPPPIV